MSESNKVNIKGNAINSDILNILLKDKTTGKNIIFATDNYEKYGPEFKAENQMLPSLINGIDGVLIQPRIAKSLEEQSSRTKQKGEVFTPAWIICKMNDHCDDEWFGRTEVFTHLNGTEWTITDEKIEFPEGKTWQEYVDCRKIEICCGEAPYIVSRYDAATGNMIPIRERVGFLDRKLRVVDENTLTEEDWLMWTYRAFQSSYGYEFQGDNLLIARINLLETFCEQVRNRWYREPTLKELRILSNIIVWNIWQMDGLTGLTPFGVSCDNNVQISLFDDPVIEEPLPPEDMRCRVYDWKANRSQFYEDLKGAQ